MLRTLYSMKDKICNEIREITFNMGILEITEKQTSCTVRTLLNTKLMQNSFIAASLGKMMIEGNFYFSVYNTGNKTEFI